MAPDLLPGLPDQRVVGDLAVTGATTWPVGSEVRILLRPDDLVAAEAGEGIDAEVGAVAFRGAETLHTLRLPDGTALSALFPSHQQKRPGERVRVRPVPAHVVVFSAADEEM